MQALTYLTMDSVQSGVGASQVLPYLERLAASGLEVELHSFEPSTGSAAAAAGLSAGLRWHPHRFRHSGQVAGMARVATGAVAIRGAGLVHARSDLAAASALVARPDAWIWDVRSFWVDQRIALGMVRRGSLVERSLRVIERQAARGATAITTLTQAAIDDLASRYGDDIAAKSQVVTTCVDLQRFKLAPLPDRPLSLLLSGSYNALYDLPSMLKLVTALRHHQPAELTFLRPTPTTWDAQVVASDGCISSATYAEMPAHVAAHHAGLAVCRTASRRALIAAMPTKLGEFLATGRPVVVNTGLGDCDTFLKREGAGVVLAGTDDADIDRAAVELLELLADPGTPARCRLLAEQHFNLDTGVATLRDLYHHIGG